MLDGIEYSIVILTSNFIYVCHFVSILETSVREKEFYWYDWLPNDKKWCKII